MTPYLVQLTFSLEARSSKNGDLVFQRWSFFSILETCMGIDDPYAKKPLYYKVLRQHYSVLHSITPVLLCTTKYYSSTTKYILLQYYSVLQSTTPVLLCTTKYYPSTTLYYKVLLQYYSVLQSTTPVLHCTTKYYSSTTLYYKVLSQYYSVLQSTTPVLLCTTKYYSSTTLHYKVLPQYYSVLQSTTPVLLCTAKYYPCTTQYYSSTTPRWRRNWNAISKMIKDGLAEGDGHQEAVCGGFGPRFDLVSDLVFFRASWIKNVPTRLESTWLD